jgi:hypothetical protein
LALQLGVHTYMGGLGHQIGHKFTSLQFPLLAILHGVIQILLLFFKREHRLSSSVKQKRQNNNDFVTIKVWKLTADETPKTPHSFSFLARGMT